MNNIQTRLYKHSTSTNEIGCWLWDGAKTRGGYGSINVGGWHGRPVRAHRVAYQTEFGPIPDGLHVLHQCDTPACVNPFHMMVGTHRQNMADMAAKGRTRGAAKMAGEAHHKAKLTAAQVIEIAASTERTSVLASRYGVSGPSISYIRNGKTWKHLRGAEVNNAAK